MKRKEPRWYRLWYYTAAMWLITFCGNLSRKEELWILVIQFLNIFVSFGAGVVNARRYKKKHGNEN